MVKISVAICTYNGERYIKEQLLSILAQSHSVDEIIISDDHSTDQTLNICKEILDHSNVSYQIIVNDPPLKVLKNFKQCFSLCQGDIIFSCDQDDVWEVDKVETIIKHFEEQADIDMIASDATLIDANGEVMNLSLKEGIGFTMDHRNEILPALLKTFCITGATMAFRKSFEAQYFYLSKYWLHDGWLALQAAMNNRFLYLNEKLTRYRLHGNNECGIGDVEILHHGTIQDLMNAKMRRVRYNVLRAPFYFEDLAKEKMAMYQEIETQIMLHHWQVDDYNKELLKECISFWKKRAELRKLSFKEMKKQRNQMIQQDAYARFCESTKFADYDLYLWFIYKLIPRRRNRT